jgi:hypothetical protein
VFEDVTQHWFIFFCMVLWCLVNAAAQYQSEKTNWVRELCFYVGFVLLIILFLETGK